jgi:hypothetical protein
MAYTDIIGYFSKMLVQISHFLNCIPCQQIPSVRHYPDTLKRCLELDRGGRTCTECHQPDGHNWSRVPYLSLDVMSSIKARRWLVITDLLSANSVNWISASGKQESSFGGRRMLSNVRHRTPLDGGFHIVDFSPVGTLNLLPSNVTLLTGMYPFF